MLTWLQIKHFAIADFVELDFQGGLSIITGETGAGKSIIINALGLVLGQRAEPRVVKHGHPRAEIQANFDLRHSEAVKGILRELELDEGDECQLRRVIHADSGSKAYINGRMVTAGTLRQVGEQLLDIHGQHEHQSLLRNETQRELLDQYAGVSQQVAELQAAFHELKASTAKLETLRADATTQHEKRAFLQYQTDELSVFSPTADEWAELSANHRRIHHQGELAAAIETAEHALFGSELQPSSASAQLNIALSELEKATHVDPELKGLNTLLLEARTLIEESRDELRRTGESITFDQLELDAIEQRYAAYMDFSRKHRVEPENLYSTHQALLAELEIAENPEQSEKNLLKEINRLSTAYTDLASTITRKRKKGAKILSTAVTESMQSLAMEGGKFKVNLQTVSSTLPNIECQAELEGIGRETGCEKISFEVSTNAGMPGLALASVASGGELSRISLALQLLLCDLTTVHSLVFDEVDVGVGGKTAAIIGKMLARLARSRQIICITHLPQVAAFGSQHFHVDKQQGKQVQLSINPLDENGKIDEIARMVGGETVTDESQAHARSLIKESSTGVQIN